MDTKCISNNEESSRDVAQNESGQGANRLRQKDQVLYPNNVEIMHMVQKGTGVSDCFEANNFVGHGMSNKVSTLNNTPNDPKATLTKNAGDAKSSRPISPEGEHQATSMENRFRGSKSPDLSPCGGIETQDQHSRSPFNISGRNQQSHESVIMKCIQDSQKVFGGGEITLEESNSPELKTSQAYQVPRFNGINTIAENPSKLKKLGQKPHQQHQMTLRQKGNQVIQTELLKRAQMLKSRKTIDINPVDLGLFVHTSQDEQQNTTQTAMHQIVTQRKNEFQLETSMPQMEVNQFKKRLSEKVSTVDHEFSKQNFNNLNENAFSTEHVSADFVVNQGPIGQINGTAAIVTEDLRMNDQDYFNKNTDAQINKQPNCETLAPLNEDQSQGGSHKQDTYLKNAKNQPAQFLRRYSALETAQLTKGFKKQHRRSGNVEQLPPSDSNLNNILLLKSSQSCESNQPHLSRNKTKNKTKSLSNAQGLQRLVSLGLGEKELHPNGDVAVHDKNQQKCQKDTNECQQNPKQPTENDHNLPKRSTNSKNFNRTSINLCMLEAQKNTEGSTQPANKKIQSNDGSILRKREHASNYVRIRGLSQHNEQTQKNLFANEISGQKKQETDHQMITNPSSKPVTTAIGPKYSHSHLTPSRAFSAIGFQKRHQFGNHEAPTDPATTMKRSPSPSITEAALKSVQGAPRGPAINLVHPRKGQEGEALIVQGDIYAYDSDHDYYTYGNCEELEELFGKHGSFSKVAKMQPIKIVNLELKAPETSQILRPVDKNTAFPKKKRLSHPTNLNNTLLEQQKKQKQLQMAANNEIKDSQKGAFSRNHKGIVILRKHQNNESGDNEKKISISFTKQNNHKSQISASLSSHRRGESTGKLVDHFGVLYEQRRLAQIQNICIDDVVEEVRLVTTSFDKSRSRGKTTVSNNQPYLDDKITLDQLSHGDQLSLRGRRRSIDQIGGDQSVLSRQNPQKAGSKNLTHQTMPMSPPRFHDAEQFFTNQLEIKLYDLSIANRIQNDGSQGAQSNNFQPLNQQKRGSVVLPESQLIIHKGLSVGAGEPLLTQNGDSPEYKDIKGAFHLREASHPIRSSRDIRIRLSQEDKGHLDTITNPSHHNSSPNSKEYISPTRRLMSPSKLEKLKCLSVMEDDRTVVTRTPNENYLQHQSDQDTQCKKNQIAFMSKERQFENNLQQEHTKLKEKESFCEDELDSRVKLDNPSKNGQNGQKQNKTDLQQNTSQNGGLNTNQRSANQSRNGSKPGNQNKNSQPHNLDLAEGTFDDWRDQHAETGKNSATQNTRSGIGGAKASFNNRQRNRVETTVITLDERLNCLNKLLEQKNKPAQSLNAARLGSPYISKQQQKVQLQKQSSTKSGIAFQKEKIDQKKSESIRQLQSAIYMATNQPNSVPDRQKHQDLQPENNLSRYQPVGADQQPQAFQYPLKKPMKCLRKLSLGNGTSFPKGHIDCPCPICSCHQRSQVPPSGPMPSLFHFFSRRAQNQTQLLKEAVWQKRVASGEGRQGFDFLKLPEQERKQALQKNQDNSKGVTRQIPGQNKQEKEKGHLRAQVLRQVPKILE